MLLLLILEVASKDEKIIENPPRFDPSNIPTPPPHVYEDDVIKYPAMESRTCETVCKRFNQDFPRKATSVWNGARSTCEVGSHNSADLEDGLRRLNLYRWLSGILKSPCTTTTAKNNLSSYCALIMDANSDLSHDPPKNWKCWTQAGRDGASLSNIAWFQADSAYAVRTYIEDPGVVSLGHRRWLLYPAMNSIGIGQRGMGNCMQIINNDFSWRETPPFVAYPAPGAFPISEVFDFWSFGADVELTGATVSIVRGDGTKVPCSVDSNNAKSGWYGQPTIRIYGISRSLLRSGMSYTVRVKKGDYTWEYTTTLVDCSSSCPAESATPTRSSTSTPTVSRSATPTASRSSTPTASRSSTPTASRSATPTASRSATATASRSSTPTASRSATATATPSPSMTSNCDEECKDQLETKSKLIMDSFKKLIKEYL